ncbi:MAG TPA: phage holin family protein [Puia sp.]|jgi:hypothetical protein|nr:phage holin family protein [Puia sp.]
MISQITHIKLLLQNFEEYVKTDVELLKLKSVDKSADIVSSVFASVIIIVAAIVFVLILSIGLSFFIGRMTGSLELGFFIMAGVWAIICASLYFSRKKWLKKPAQDIVVKKILD